MCNEKIILCDEVVTNEAAFPQFYKNTYSSGFYLAMIVNKNYKKVSDLSFQTLRIEQLDLSNNRIETVEKRAFDKITGLRSLNVSYNEIKDIDVNYLADLEVLILKNNKFTRIVRVTFVNLTKLKYLDFFWNDIETVEKLAFSRSAQLRWIDLRSNKLKSLNFDLNLKLLVSLSLSSNQIASYSSGFFSNLIALKILMLEKNELRDLDPSEMVNMKQLKILTLDDNYVEFVNLEKLAFSLVGLITLNMTRNNVKVIKSVDTVNGSCKQTNKVQDLNMNGNNIGEIEPFSFACFDLLTSLNLFNQQLSRISSPYIFFGLKKLKSLKLNNNSLTRIYNRTFIQLGNLSSLDLSSNQLELLDSDAFLDLYNLTELLLFDNCLKTVTSYLFRSLTRLSTLDLSQNRLVSVDENGFSGLENSLKTLRINSNRLQFLKNYFFNNLGGLLYLNLQNNQISSVQRAIFRNMVNLTTLVLADNSIAHIDPLLFLNLANLKYLDLSSNVLVGLDQGTFRYLQKLTEINLRFNILCKINFQRVFSTGSEILLEKLNLENNLINELDMNWFAGLDKLQYLNLNNNDLNIKVNEKRNNISILGNLKSLCLRKAPLHLVRQFNFTNLIELDLSYSHIDADILRILPFNVIESIKLAKLRGITSVDLSFWKTFNPKLRHLDLSFNQFSLEHLIKHIKESLPYQLVLVDVNINNSFFLVNNLLSSLDILDLSCNKISGVPYSNFFTSHQGLRHLNLSHNSIVIILKQTFK
jgi:Leucine-rich repeat (LRR) protein